MEASLFNKKLTILRCCCKISRNKEKADHDNFYKYPHFALSFVYASICFTI